MDLIELVPEDEERRKAEEECCISDAEVMKILELEEERIALMSDISPIREHRSATPDTVINQCFDFSDDE